ncbi:RNA polymerase sigma-70 factor [Pedobacter nutrimenti]|uniref:RNA polymerase sigma factor n=1 Tax=Pedobacter nutrimenti TaxID=1241337 RepID=UPI002931C58A|nr:RNA polymerase sigma-70 factor [Pedobacter nutrimenti]
MAIKPLPNEIELLLSIAEGNQHAFTAVFDYYYDYVFSFGRKLTRSEELAKEVAQDIFMKIWFGRSNLVKIENFGAFVNRLVRNHSFDLLRKLAMHERASHKIELSSSESDTSTEQSLDYNETLKILEEAIELLPDQQKKVYILCHQEGLKYEEAGKKLNISSATVHYHMKLALNVIRSHFKRNAIVYPMLMMYFLK